MRNIRVALLDSGIIDNLSKYIKINDKKSFSYDYCNYKIIESENVTDINGHGTMCLYTILSVFDCIEFSIIRILNVSGVTTEEVLVEAMKYVSVLDVDIVAICASLKFNKRSQKLKEICEAVSKSGKIIVASVENGKSISEPASYNCVIGVIGGVLDDKEYCYFPNAKIQMQCSSAAMVTIGAFGIRTIFQGNSRATALAVAHIAKIMYECNYRTEILDAVLRQKSAHFLMKKYAGKFDNYVRIPFDNERESYLIDNNAGYKKFIYALCEFYLCDNPQYMRTRRLIDFEGRYILRRMENFLRFIEELFEIRLTNVKLEDFQWAYLFYDRYLNFIEGA